MFLEGTLEPSKLKGNEFTIFYIWHFCLATVHKLLAWEVGLDSLSTFHGLAVCCLCLEFGNVGNRGLILLGRFWGLEVLSALLSLK